MAVKATIICTVLMLAVTYADRDWSKIKFFDPPNGGLNPRIVGGEEAVPHSFPYQAALFMNTSQGTYFCGGSLVSLTTILTAAHCVDKARQVEVVLGAHNITQSEPTQKTYISTNITYHNKWSSLFLINDIAVIVLPEAVELDENIQLIALPRRSDVGNSFSGQIAKISGWGKTTDKATSISDVLRYVDREVITNLSCGLRFIGSIRSTHICTTGSKKKNPCNGDSGGPLVIDSKQVGVVSFGYRRCQKGWPAVFTRTTKFLDWIAKNSDVVIN